MMKNTRNTPQQRDINIFFAEYFIYVRPCATQLSCKPCHRTPLLVKRASYKLSDMQHTPSLFIRTPNGHVKSNKRRRNLTFARSEFQGLRMPTCQERATQKAHADMYTACPFPKREGQYVNIHTTRTLPVAICSFDRSKGAKF